MKLQISVDLLSLNQALNVVQDIAPFVDIIEVGASLIKQHGIAAVAIIKERFPEKLLSANLKIINAGGMEANIAFEAGADFTTALAIANDSTIVGALASARKYNRTIIADMKLVPDLEKRARELEGIGIKHFKIDCDLDDQFRHLTPQTIERLTSLCQLKSTTLIAAGAVNQNVIPQLKELGVEIAAFGSIIYASSNPKAVARQIREAINH